MRMRSDEDWKELMDTVCAAEPKSDEFSVEKWASFIQSPHGVSKVDMNCNKGYIELLLYFKFLYDCLFRFLKTK